MEIILDLYLLLHIPYIYYKSLTSKTLQPLSMNMIMVYTGMLIFPGHDNYFDHLYNIYFDRMMDIMTIIH